MGEEVGALSFLCVLLMLLFFCWGEGGGSHPVLVRGGVVILKF